MGMYTELHLGVAIKDDPIVVKILKDMSTQGASSVKGRLDHPFFKTPRCDAIGWCDSYYFDSQSYITFIYDEIANCWFLTTTFNLKNYDDEIQKFLDWLCPYILSEGYIGTFMYEEWEHPNFIYKRNGRIEYESVKPIMVYTEPF